MNTQYNFNIIKQESDQFIIELTNPQELKDVKTRDIVRYCNNQFDFDKVECGDSYRSVIFSLKTLEQGEDIEHIAEAKFDYNFYLACYVRRFASKETADKYAAINIRYVLERDESTYTSPEFTKSDDIIHTMRACIYDKLDCYKNKYVIFGINGTVNDDYDLTLSSFNNIAHNLNHILDKRIFLVLDFKKLC
jgi:hypothetical protein